MGSSRTEAAELRVRLPGERDFHLSALCLFPGLGALVARTTNTGAGGSRLVVARRPGGGGIKALHPSYRDFQLKKKKERERETGRCFPRVLKCCRRCCLPCTPWLLRSPDSVSPAHGSPGVLGPRLRHRQPRGPVAWGSGPRPVVWRLLLGSPFPAV